MFQNLRSKVYFFQMEDANRGPNAESIIFFVIFFGAVFILRVLERRPKECGETNTFSLAKESANICFNSVSGVLPKIQASLQTCVLYPAFKHFRVNRRTDAFFILLVFVKKNHRPSLLLPSVSFCIYDVLLDRTS